MTPERETWLCDCVADIHARVISHDVDIKTMKLDLDTMKARKSLPPPALQHYRTDTGTFKIPEHEWDDALKAIKRDFDAERWRGVKDFATKVAAPIVSGIAMAVLGFLAAWLLRR